MALDDIGFVHLHVHSSYSLLEGALPIAKLAKLASADKMPALALTDSNNLYGALEFSEKLAGEGIQPIVGLQLSLDLGDADRQRQGRKRLPSIVLLSATAEGYANLMRLSSRALIDASLLDGWELDWLNTYHARVLHEVAPHVEPAVRVWLQAACERIG